MTKSQLKSIIQEIVQRKLTELDIKDPTMGETGLSDADKKELANLKATSDKLTEKIKAIEGDIAKMQQTIQPKIQKAERDKAKLQKQQADVIHKQQAIQDRAT